MNDPEPLEISYKTLLSGLIILIRIFLTSIGAILFSAISTMILILFICLLLNVFKISLPDLVIPKTFKEFNVNLEAKSTLLSNSFFDLLILLISEFSSFICSF